MEKHKEILGYIREAVILTIIPLVLTSIIQICSMESVTVDISPSFKAEDKYVTEIVLQNRKKSTLSEISIFTNVGVLDLETEDSFVQRSEYIKLAQLTPNEKYGMLLWTSEPIHKGDIVVEAKYKVYLSYSEEESSFWGRTGQYLISYGITLFIVTIIQLKLDSYFHKKISEKAERAHNELKEINEKQNKRLERQDADIVDLKKDIRDAKRERAELKLYYIARITDLRKELDFWRNTVRKLLYEGKNKGISTDDIMDTVTSTLKTYTIRESNKDDIDAIMYVAEHITRDKNHFSFDKKD